MDFRMGSNAAWIACFICAWDTIEMIILVGARYKVCISIYTRRVYWPDQVGTECVANGRPRCVPEVGSAGKISNLACSARYCGSVFLSGAGVAILLQRTSDYWRVCVVFYDVPFENRGLCICQCCLKKGRDFCRREWVYFSGYEWE